VSALGNAELDQALAQAGAPEMLDQDVSRGWVLRWGLFTVSSEQSAAGSYLVVSGPAQYGQGPTIEPGGDNVAGPSANGVDQALWRCGNENSFPRIFRDQPDPVRASETARDSTEDQGRLGRASG